jgi:glycine/D-amino acid oxidase-like deaminating enzyme
VSVSSIRSGEAIAAAQDVTTKSSLATQPYWIDSEALPAFAKLDGDDHVDVVIVGGGITGLTAAYLLTQDGRRVALLERERCVQIDTGHTTAHLTMVTDEGLSTLVKRFGRDHAGAAWEAGLAAIAQIDSIVADLALDCDFAWVPGYVHAPVSKPVNDAARQELRDEASLAAGLGFDASFTDAVPFVGGPGIRFDGQARFHPTSTSRGWRARSPTAAA